MDSQNTTHVVIKSEKSAGVAFLLAFFFGPLGMVYSTIPGAIIMMIVTPIIAIPTVGLGLFITQPICIIWSISALKKTKAAS